MASESYHDVFKISHLRITQELPKQVIKDSKIQEWGFITFRYTATF